MKSTSNLACGYWMLLGSVMCVYPAKAHASLMCMVNRAGDPGVANICDDAAGSPVSNHTAAQVGNPIHALNGNKYRLE